MLLVHTSQPKVLQQLQEEFRRQEGAIAVPVKQAKVLVQVLEGIQFEHFHGRTSGLAKMVKEYVRESMNFRHSLDLYRDIMKEIRGFQEREEVYQEYLLAMDQQINEEILVVQPLSEGKKEQEMQLLPQESFYDENRSSSLLEMVDLPLLKLDSNKSQEEEAQSQHTKNSATTSGTSKETLGSFAKLGNFLYSASAVYSRQEWQTQRSKQDSRQINSFNKKGEGVIQANSNLCSLIASEMAYDIKRELFDTGEKQTRLMQQRYKRRIKDTLLYSKIGLRRRK